MSVSVKVEHVNPFIKATLETFSKMLSVQIQMGKPRLKGDTNATHDVSGIIGLSGDAKGAVALSFPLDTALDAVSRFIGEKVTEMNADVHDAIGELANIIAGAAKRDLTDFKISISLPTVVSGTGHQIYEARDVLSMLIPFSYEGKTFDLAVTLKSKD
jgi:chemotaxis protein CheX